VVSDLPLNHHAENRESYQILSLQPESEYIYIYYSNKTKKSGEEQKNETKRISDRLVEVKKKECED
jgi:hypothetical protein